MKGIMIIGLLALGLLVVSSTTFADVTTISRAEIIKLGARGTYPIVIVTGAPLINNTLFRCNPNNEKQQLAVLLTAYTLGKTVQMRVADTLNGSLIDYVYINPY